MLKAGAIVYAIFLALMLSMICTSYILLNYYHKLEVEDTIGRKQLLRSSKATLNSYLAVNSSENPDKLFHSNKANDYKVASTIVSNAWGVYELLKVHSSWNHHFFHSVALAGVDIYKDKRCLVLTDRNKPLSLAGRTKIIGDCELPKSGVKRAYVEGQNFTGKSLVQGNVTHSSAEMPRLQEEMIQHNLSRLDGETNLEDSIMDYQFAIESTDTIINSYFHKTLYLTSKEVIEIQDIVLKGNIIIYSSNQVNVKTNAKLEGLLIYSPVISVDRGFEGNLQAFASDSIYLNEDVHLSYPSVLSLIRNTPNEGQFEIIISENSSVDGAVILNHSGKTRNSRGVIQIRKNSTIKGQVYSNDLISHQGEILGITYCNGFTLRTPSSLYENLLLNSVLDRSHLSSYHIGAALIGSYPSKSIMKWFI